VSAKKPHFKPVSPKVSFPELEEEILKFWKKEKIFEKSLSSRKKGKPFVFYEGPPTANGKPGIHHVESRAFKDIIPRYKTMQGYYCGRKAGWDCHGLPVELEVEKKLGISGKNQIEEFGVEKFNDLCRKSVFEYVDEWSKLTERIGYWVDLTGAYETLDNKYIESEWWILKSIWDKGWLYEDYKVVPYCARCGTSLSTHELAQGYKDDVEDPSIYIKFKLKSKENTYFLAWTTTPWTLPGNVALAVAPKESYVEIESEGVNLILAEKRLSALKIDGKVVKKYKGKDLEGWQYVPLLDFVSYDKKAHFVIPADYVSMEEGTGIVHTAVMYGEDDFALGKKFDLPQKHVVNEKGEFTDEVAPYAGKFVKDADSEIISDLDKMGLLFKSETIKHTYPFCWRCATPLLYYAITAWYLKTTAVKEELLKNNNSVNWIPSHIKEGRMGEWLENNRDWALSRSRYWGTPLPIWRCDSCSETMLVGSVKELGELSGRDLSKLDLHRPFIDEVVFKCKCGGDMHRVNFVLDCWFDSGAMPFGEWHYPFENKEKFEDNFPADYISEAIDQTRGWFYTLLAVSTLLEKGPSYKNVICLGHVLDDKGNKMSKSKGNVVDPWTVVNEIGADAVRWYFYSVISPGPSFRFSSGLVGDVVKRFFLTLWNSYVYFVTYANLNDWEPGKELKAYGKKLNVLDKWILTRLRELINNATKQLDAYDLFSATAQIENFIINDFSRWYIRRSRGRTDPEFFQTSFDVLTTICKLMAPFAPFITDAIYKNLTGEGSVHLADWPERSELGETEQKVLKDMELVREIVEKGHSARKEAVVPVRQPLSSIKVISEDSIPDSDVPDLIADELNVKKVLWEKGNSLTISLDTKLTLALKEEGKTRELIRQIQGKRKKLGINLDQEIIISAPWLPENPELLKILKTKTLASKVEKGSFKVEPS
jgi:isoleucyl-tRNA synthetase